MNPRLQRIFQAAGALTGWFAVLLQFFLLLANRKQDLAPTVIQFFSYFTILTNILAALYYTMQLFRPADWPGASKTTALAVYIFIVGLVYNLVLRTLWQPQGWQLLVDTLLHTVNPILFLLYWLLFFRRSLPWRAAFGWLWYPFLYLLYVLARGAVAHVYPYPFLDVTALGYAQVLLNALLLFLVFLFFSFLFLVIGRVGRRSLSRTAGTF